MIRPLLAALIAAPALGAPPTIDDIAPKESFLILRIQDYPAMREALDRTPAWRLSDQPAVRAWGERVIGRALESFAEELEGIGAEPGDVPEPVGHLGLAFWVDDDTTLDEPDYLAVAEFGDGAAEAFELAVELAEQRADDGEIRITSEEYGPFELLTFTTIVEERTPEERREFIEEMRGVGMDPEQLEFLADMLDEEALPWEWFLAQTGGSVIFGTDRDRVHAALDFADGRDIEAVAGSEDLALGRSRVAGSTLDIVLRTNTALEFIEQEADAFWFVPGGVWQALGLREIGVISAGLRLDGPDAQASLPFFMQLSERAGVFSLFRELGSFAPPAFVGADSASVTAFAFDFPGLLPLARDLIASLPEEGRAQAEGALTAFSIAAAPVLQSIGPECYVISKIDRPIGADSEQMVLAIRVNNEAAVGAAVSQYGQRLGVAARDFLGHQIWETPAGIGPSVGVGVGGGWAFVGFPIEVERAFRALADDGADALAPSPPFLAATGRLAKPALAYSFTSTAPMLEYYRWLANHPEEVVRARFEGMGWEPDEEFVRYLIEEAKTSFTSVMMREAPDDAVLLSGLGDSVSEVRFTPEGITGRVMLLRPVR